jgi:hypothetical protein
MFRIHERNIAEHREGDRGTSGIKEYKKQMYEEKLKKKNKVLLEN